MRTKREVPMKKSLILLSVLYLAACTAQSKPAEEVSSSSQVESSQSETMMNQEVVVSNLVDEQSRNELKNLLRQNGVEQANLDKFFEEVNSYNQTIENLSLVDGFTKKSLADLHYDIEGISQKLTTKQPDFLGRNCRITTFTLLNNFVISDKLMEQPAENLIFDKESLKSHPLFDEQEEAVFTTWFASIPTDKTTNVATHVANVQKEFQKRGLRFQLPGKLSILSVFFHDDLDADKLFIGHVGVLIPTETEYLFVEKLSFEDPYQVLRFKDKHEVNSYLMSKYGQIRGHETADPFIMENDQLMKEYKAN